MIETAKHRMMDEAVLVLLSPEGEEWEDHLDSRASALLALVATKAEADHMTGLVNRHALFALQAATSRYVELGRVAAEFKRVNAAINYLTMRLANHAWWKAEGRSASFREVVSVEVDREEGLLTVTNYKGNPWFEAKADPLHDAIKALCEMAGGYCQEDRY